MKNQINKQKLETEVSELYSDMAVLAALANDESAHGPVSDEIKAEIAADIKRDLSSLLAEADSIKAIFVIAMNDDNKFRSIHAGELPALTRVVMLSGVESMKLAQSLANEIRSCMTEQDGEDAPEVDNNANEAL